MMLITLGALVACLVIGLYTLRLNQPTTPRDSKILIGCGYIVGAFIPVVNVILVILAALYWFGSESLKSAANADKNP